MTDLSETLKAMRRQVEVEQESPMAQFRSDFALVWKTWIDRREETKERYEEAGRAVKEHLKDEQWMRGAMNHFAQMAASIRRDQERVARIRAERLVEREAAKRSDSNGVPLPELNVRAAA